MEGAVPHKAMDPVNWENYYTHRCWAAPSSFCSAILSSFDIPDTVVDLGCGDGRDSYAFAAAGKTVVGLDRSPRAVAIATARSAGLARVPRFQVCDLADAEVLREQLAGAHIDGPIAVYLRFVLHATEPETEARIFDALRDGLRPGDYVAVEFRTKNDRRDAVSTGRLNRLIDSTEFGTRLRELLNCDVVDERQGTGLCTDDGNDPHVYRLIARISAVGADA
jgi:SAM-dependent methyltransferase